MDGSGVRAGMSESVLWTGSDWEVDPFQPVTGNVQKGRSECAASSETLRNLVHSSAFFIAFSLFVLLLFGKLM